MKQKSQLSERLMTPPLDSWQYVKMHIKGRAQACYLLCCVIKYKSRVKRVNLKASRDFSLNSPRALQTFWLFRSPIKMPFSTRVPDMLPCGWQVKSPGVQPNSVGLKQTVTPRN